ncbi:MAG: hypothetical protein JJU03_00155 [Idiomarina sp.]|nr:hypothetical protein [Idiomarina sp.]
MHSRALEVEASTITFTLDLKIDNLEEGADALTMLRFDNAGGESLEIINSELLTTQTNEWQTVEISGDIEEGTNTVVFGFILRGEGTVHFRHPRFSADGEPSTIRSPQAPRAETAEPVETSGIAYDDLEAEHVPAIQALGQVWGFLKYHHPDVTRGLHQWDLALFEQVSLMVEALSEDNHRSVVINRLHAWLDDLDVDATQQSNADDGSWVSGIPGSVAKRLASLAEQDVEQQFYVGIEHGFLSFLDEPGYNHLQHIDAGFALLSLFRIAGIYEHFAPYRDLAPERDQALANAIESLTDVHAEPQEQATLSAMRAINGYLVSLQDGHVDLGSRPSVKPLQGECELPAQLIIIDGQLVVQSLFDEGSFDADFAPGHVIQQIDGVDVAKLINDSAPHYSGSTPGQVHLRIAGDIGLGACERAALSVVDAAGHLSSVEVERVEASGQSASRGPIADNLSTLDNAVYIHLHAFSESMYPELADLLSSHDDLIIDARGYPKEFVALSLPEMFAQEDYDFVRLNRASLTQPGQFEWRPNQPFIGAGYCDPCLDNWQGRIALLVDETTVSQGEYTVMALQGLQSEHIDVQTIGSTTAGTNGNFANIPLPGPMGTRISGIGVFYPDGTPTQQRGVRIDRPVAYTLESIRAEQDPILDAALDWLRQR